MLRVALSMLVGDRVKYLGLVLGVAFSTLMVIQQASLFVGVIRLSAFLVRANPDIDVWVLRPGSGGAEIVEQMPEAWLGRVRSVSGVAWAMPLYRGATFARADNGYLFSVGIVGVDDVTLAGAPFDMIAGQVSDLHIPNSVIADISTFKRLFGDRPVTDTPAIEIGKKLVRVVGVCRAVKTITGGDVVYTRRSVAVRLGQEPNNTVSLVMVKAQPESDPIDVAREIERRTGLDAFTREEFVAHITDWTLEMTGIVQVLGSVIVMGVVIGVLVVGQTFYLFAYENQRYFATFKAMGASDLTIIRMLGFQAMLVSIIGYGLGLGGANAILIAGDNDLSPMRGLVLESSVMIAVGLLTPILVLITAMLGARRVLSAEPGSVFR
jgi:putative ABC transport system permease protein